MYCTYTARTMAEEDDTRIRILQSLRGKICEAKNLGPCPGPNRLRDLCTFCTISLDQEEVFRTKISEKSPSSPPGGCPTARCVVTQLQGRGAIFSAFRLMMVDGGGPFYGEDFYFEIPRPFQYLSFYVYAKSVFRDLPVGKVAIRKEDLCKYSGKEHWFCLQPVDPNSEVQVGGDRIIECQGLPLINGQSCDPYATVSLVGPARSDQKKTKVKKKTSNPQFEETFYFEVTRSSSYTKKSHFQVEEEDIEKLEINILWPPSQTRRHMCPEIQIHSIKFIVPGPRYLLQPKGNGNKTSKPDDLGSLRLNVTYTEDNVLPSGCYTPLRNLLLKSPDVKVPQCCLAGPL
ncbi:hypothetical protein JZ751_001948 [Albula glossodonta]|uniref:C2 domain-containing protein n=1 Tax=Albula glossodonta TaxID=121402 RepID=A0A8T2P428_9TELE|nr:hypothetical protein JZ751_001948 [Albula glossodonta]